MATLQLTALEIYEELKAASFQGYENGKEVASQFPCGNAVVMLSSARTKFAQDMKRLNIARPWHGRPGLALDTYRWQGFASGGQSHDMNVEICAEMVRLLESHGIDAYVHSWID